MARTKNVSHGEDSGEDQIEPTQGEDLADDINVSKITKAQLVAERQRLIAKEARLVKKLEAAEAAAKKRSSSKITEDPEDEARNGASSTEDEPEDLTSSKPPSQKRPKSSKMAARAQDVKRKLQASVPQDPKFDEEFQMFNFWKANIAKQPASAHAAVPLSHVEDEAALSRYKAGFQQIQKKFY